MYQTGFNAYEHSEINTVEDQGTILIKLYDGAIRFLNLAQKGITEGRINVRGEKISQTMAIITELHCALDMDQGGEMAQNLASLYRHLINRLTVANRHNDLHALMEVKEILLTLKEGFEAVVMQQRPRRKASASIPSVYGDSPSGHQEGLRCAI